MALVVPFEGELELLRKMIIDKIDNETYTLKVYQNNYSPISTTTLTDFTEANFTGYTSVVIDRADWADPTIDASGEALTSTTMYSWTCGMTGNTVYGYYVVGTSSGKVLWAERFQTTRILGDNDILHIVPQFTLKSAN